MILVLDGVILIFRLDILIIEIERFPLIHKDTPKWMTAVVDDRSFFGSNILGGPHPVLLRHGLSLSNQRETK